MTVLAAVQPGDPHARPGTVPVEGCRHCGAAKREHCQRWHPDVGWHGWTEPTREQIRQRMRANRGLPV